MPAIRQLEPDGPARQPHSEPFGWILISFSLEVWSARQRASPNRTSGLVLHEHCDYAACFSSSAYAAGSDSYNGVAWGLHLGLGTVRNDPFMSAAITYRFHYST